MNDANQKRSVERFSGFADVYDSARPELPSEIVDELISIAQMDRPGLVVDIGCGTGLSTRVWVDRAEKVIGIEPSEDMRCVAERSTNRGNITFHKGFSHQTGLVDNSADIVTCVQCLHWLEPVSTFAEIARILRDGGVFAAIDCDWPQSTSNIDANAVYADFLKHLQKFDKDWKKSGSPERWQKSEHLERIKAIGHFHNVQELVFKHTETGNAERLKNLVMSFGEVVSILKQGYTESDIGLDTFREKVDRILRDEMRPWTFCYRVRVGIV